MIDDLRGLAAREDAAVPPAHDVIPRHEVISRAIAELERTDPHGTRREALQLAARDHAAGMCTTRDDGCWAVTLADGVLRDAAQPAAHGG